MVTIEQIDEFRKRTNSSYEDARVFLERHQGDVLEAIIDFEKAKAGWRPPVKKPPHKGEFGRWIMDLLQKGFDLRMTVEDKTGKMMFTVPILLLLLLTPAWPLLLFTCLFLILLGYKLGFRDIKSTAVNVKEIFNSLGTQLRDVGTQPPHRGANAAPNGFSGGMGQPGQPGHPGQQRYGGAAGQPGAFGWQGTPGPQSASAQGVPPGQNGPAGPTMTTQSFGRTGTAQPSNAQPFVKPNAPTNTIPNAPAGMAHIQPTGATSNPPNSGMQNQMSAMKPGSMSPETFNLMAQMSGTKGFASSNAATSGSVPATNNGPVAGNGPAPSTPHQTIGFIQPADTKGSPPVGQVLTLPADSSNAMGQPLNLNRRHEDRLQPLDMESRFGVKSTQVNETASASSAPQPAEQAISQSADISVTAPEATVPGVGYTSPETQPVTEFLQEDDGFTEFTIE